MFQRLHGFFLGVRFRFARFLYERGFLSVVWASRIAGVSVREYYGMIPLEVVDPLPDEVLAIMEDGELLDIHNLL